MKKLKKQLIPFVENMTDSFNTISKMPHNDTLRNVDKTLVINKVDYTHATKMPVNKTPIKIYFILNAQYAI